MSQLNPQVDQFVSSVCKRIDSHRTRNVAIWTTLVGGALMLAVAICYVWPGYRVPWLLYPCVALMMLWCGFCVALFLRSSDDEAATFADRFFDLKNSLGSCLRFAREGKQGGFYELQASQAQGLVKSLAVEDISYQPPWRLIVPGVLLVGIAVMLGFKPASPEVIARLEEEKNTLAMTAATNEELKELVDELEKSTDDEDERKLLEPDKLRQWVDELKETTDIREAKRQYSKMEMRLNRAAEALRQRRDEKLMDKAADELQKDPESAELSKDLKHKKYDKAADKLKKLKPGDKNDQKFKPGKLSKSRKDLAKLKAAAKRMAAAAEKTRGGGSKSKGGESSDSKPSDGEASEMSEDASESDDLAEMIEELDDAVEEFDRELEELELEEGAGDQDLERGEGDDDLDEAERNARARLDELGDRLRKMARRRRARNKLKNLSKKVARSQSSSGTMESERKGGKRAGEGSDDSFRDQQDERIDNGQNTKLKGLKGKGPSLTQVQAADDGDGTSNRRSEAKQRDFKRQFESFVDREDIPEDLKNGVKEYFTNIHQAEEPSAEPSDVESKKSDQP